MRKALTSSLTMGPEQGCLFLCPGVIFCFLPSEPLCPVSFNEWHFH